MKEKLPNVALYPIYGNHEQYPADQFDFKTGTTQWLKDECADMWKGILDESSLASLREHGYYS